MRGLKKLTAFVTALIITVLLLLDNPMYVVQAKEVTGGALVLMELDKNDWYAQSSLVIETTNKVKMVAINKLAEYTDMTFSFSSKKKELTVKKGSKYNVYTLSSKNYICYTVVNKKTTAVKKAASNKAYYDKSSGNYYIQAAAVNNLLSYKAYAAKDYKYYKDTGYSGIICYSKVGKISKLPFFSNVKTIYGRALTTKQLKRYTSPDGKWSTKMYYMDGYVNGVRKQWPMVAKESSTQTVGSKYKAIDVKLEFSRYTPFDYTSKGPGFSLTVKPTTVAGVTYTKKNFGYVGYMSSNRDNWQIEVDGDVDLTSDPTDEAFNWLTGERIHSDWPDEQQYFKDFEVRFDVLDREEGIIVGYIRFMTKDGSGNIVDVEGYFAESYKDDGDRPEADEINYELHPEQYIKVNQDTNTGGSSTGGSNGGTGSNNSSGNTGGTTTPSLTYVTCTACGGTGKITCTVCSGVGYKERYGYQYGQYGLIIDTCLSCGGAGARLCGTCGGSGSVLKIK